MRERLRGRWTWLDTALDVQDRVGAVGGGALAASITLSGFLSLFPLLLVGIAATGFVAAGNEDLARDVVERMGLEGAAADMVTSAVDTAEGSRRAASVVGLAGLLWGGLAVVGAVAAASDAFWQVTGKGLWAKAHQLLWLVGVALAFLASLGLASLAALLPGPLTVLLLVATLVLDVALFLWTFTVLGATHVGWRTHLPGAVLAGVGFEVLKAVGTVLLPRSVASSSALYGTLGVVFAVLAWLALYGRLVVYSLALNVVRHEARAGTLTVEIEVPRIDGEVPLAANRGGAVVDRAEA
ncbi:MAG: YhjD/YihY/BrkB family envelope integrity protein [Acidimicrobiia bacterium]